MEVGMLWYDDTKKELSEKVARAVEYYKTKYGVAPTLCFVNPSMLRQAEVMGSVQVRPARTVLANHLWLGVGEVPAKSESKPAPRRKKIPVQG